MPPERPAKQLNPFEPPAMAGSLGFAQQDPMQDQTPPAASSPQPEIPARITRPGKAATTSASGARPSGPDSPVRSSASTAPTTMGSSFQASFDKAGFRRIFRELIGTMGAAANEKLTRTEEAKNAGVWLADDDDKKDIGDPLGNIAVRRLGLAKWKQIDDVEDFVNLVAAGGAYVMGNVNKLLDLSRQRRLRRVAQHTRVDELTDQNGATQ